MEEGVQLVARELLRSPTIVPLFGSSELTHEVANRADRFFARAPTGFSVLSVGDRGALLLHHVLAVAALGSSLKGRPVVISLGPAEFMMGDRKPRRRAFFAGNFSRLHATTALLTHGLSPRLRRDIDRRLLEYGDVLSSDAVLESSARLELAGSTSAKARLALLRPVALFDVAWLTLADHVSGALTAFRHQDTEQRGSRQMQAPID